MHSSTTYIYTLSLHDALPIFAQAGAIINDAEDRLLLYELIRYWSVFINSKTGEFPVFQLQPYNSSSRTSEQSALQNHPASPERNRKSTRLNSSHPSISYAVFC